MEHPTFRKAVNGTIILKASPEARALPRQAPRAQAPYRAKKPEEVDSEAWAQVVSEGQYRGRTFHWLLENDVGYSVNRLASHQKERERTEAQSPLMANKDAFARYSSAYPDFVELVRFQRAFEEARAKSLQPGQEGQALVGFGDFKFESLESLYDSTDRKRSALSNTCGRRHRLQGRRWRTPSSTSVAETDRGPQLLLHLPPPAPAAAQPLHRPQAREPRVHRSLLVQRSRLLSLGGVLYRLWRCRPRLRSWWPLGLHIQPPTSAPSDQLCPPPGHLWSLRMKSWSGR